MSSKHFELEKFRMAAELAPPEDATMAYARYKRTFNPYDFDPYNIFHLAFLVTVLVAAGVVVLCFCYLCNNRMRKRNLRLKSSPKKTSDDWKTSRDFMEDGTRIEGNGGNFNEANEDDNPGEGDRGKASNKYKIYGAKASYVPNKKGKALKLGMAAGVGAVVASAVASRHTEMQAKADRYSFRSGDDGQNSSIVGLFPDAGGGGIVGFGSGSADTGVFSVDSGLGDSSGGGGYCSAGGGDGGGGGGDCG